MPDNPIDLPSPEEFAGVLLCHKKGIAAHDEASEALKRVVEAVKLTGKAGAVSVTLEISPVKNNESVVQLKYVVGHKIPKEARAAIWFADDEGKLHRNDPTQMSFYDTDTEPADGKSAAAGRD